MFAPKINWLPITMATSLGAWAIAKRMYLPIKKIGEDLIL